MMTELFVFIGVVGIVMVVLLGALWTGGGE